MPNTRQLAFLSRVRHALTNATTETDLAVPLGEMGYTPEMLATGLALVAEAEREAREADTERAEARAATKTAGQARAKVRQTFIRLTKLARSVHDEGSAAYTTLDLGGERPRSSVVLAEARRFYEALLGDEALLGPLAVRKVTADPLRHAVEDVDAAEAASAAQVAEAGEAQVATAERDTAVEVVAGWWEDFSDVADVALDTPQLREKLGMQQAGS